MVGLWRLRRTLIGWLAPAVAEEHRNEPQPWFLDPVQAGLVWEAAHRLCWHLAGSDTLSPHRFDLLDALHGRGVRRLERRYQAEATAQAYVREYA